MKTTLTKYLPANCVVNICVSNGVIGCNMDIPYTPLEVEGGAALSACFYPNIPGLQVKKYSIARKNFSIDDILTADVPVKALLIFVTNRGSYVVNELLIRSLWGKKVQVAVGGGVTELTDSLLGSILAFSGPNVEVASILIGYVDREKEIRSKLKALKETGLHNQDCFAYMFSTIERGTCIHSKVNLESSIFSEIFPNIPITGLFGYHVFGANFLPHLKLKTWNLDHGHFVKTRKNYRYGHCTVFVLIAVKKDNNCEIIKDKESV